MDDLLIVPVRQCADGAVALRTGLLDQDRQRVGIAFTTQGRLRAALGERQSSIRLSARALRAMLRPLGIVRLQVDPLLVAAEVPVVRTPPPSSRPLPALAGRR